MMYKYQLETIDYLRNVVDKLEKKTNERYKICIGQGEATKVNYGAFRNEETRLNGKLYLLINYSSYYEIIWKFDEYCQDRIIFSDSDFFDWIELDKDVFLKINKTIDNIISDNKEREEFHERLNHELKCLNKSLE